MGKKQKILAIYDLNIMPFSIGDIVSFIAGVQVLLYRSNINTYDICFISNCNHCSATPFNKLVNSNNRIHYYLKLVDVLQINKNLESIHYCNSYEDFYEIYSLKSSDQHLIWPELSAIQNQEYLHYRIYRDLHFFKQEFGFLPSVFNSSSLTQWAHVFFNCHTNDYIPVTVNLRNNKLFSDHRNAQLDSWLGFFAYCNMKYPIKFLVICAKTEIDDRLYRCSNVIIVKNLNTSIAQDIALIANAPLHLGSASGPATISPFVSHPSLITNCDMAPYMELYHSALKYYRDDKHVRFSFSHEFQYYSTFPETTDYLMCEFEKLWNAVDIEAWKNTSHYWQNYGTEETLSWLD